MNELNKTQTNTLPDSKIYNLEQGKIPPQAIDLEQAVLGAMLIDKRGVDEAFDILDAQVFYKDAHQKIYEAISLLFEEAQPIDLLTVSEKLKQMEVLNKVGGDFYLVQLSKKISSSANIEFHSRILLQKFIKRSLIRISAEISEDSYDDSNDVFKLLDETESKLFEINQNFIKKNTDSARNLVIAAKKRIEEIAKIEGLSGVASGFDKLDELTSGWQPSDLIVIAARPGMGKTALTLSMARNIAVERNIPVAFFSLEMSSVQLITRLISSETGLNSQKLRTGNLEKHEWEQLNVKVQDLEKSPLYIDDTSRLSVFELRAKARRLVSQKGVKIIFIDYLQLMSAASNNKNGNREQEISLISRSLKSLAKELNIPIIALAQLSRAVETRTSGSKRPILSDLRESGAIEQDSDIVSFIYRPEYYKFTEWDDKDATSCLGQAEIIMAKHRNGSLGNVRLKFIGGLGKFDNLSPFDNDNDYVQSKANSENHTPDKDSNTDLTNYSVNPNDAFPKSDEEEDTDGGLIH